VNLAVRKCLRGLLPLASGRLPEDNADRHWFAAETELMQQQAVHDGTVWARETQGLSSPGTRAHAAHNGFRSTGQEPDDLAQRAQHTVSTGESLRVQTARLPVQANAHETLYQERAAEDAAPRDERLDAKADASAGKAAAAIARYATIQWPTGTSTIRPTPASDRSSAAAETISTRKNLHEQGNEHRFD
jgi:hypothetical protein